MVLWTGTSKRAKRLSLLPHDFVPVASFHPPILQAGGQRERVNYLMNSLQRTSQGKNNLVVLMHDAHAKTMTVDFLQKAIDYLREQGYEFDNFYSIIK